MTSIKDLKDTSKIADHIAAQLNISIFEKQKLLEIPQVNDIAQTFIELTNFSFYENVNGENILQ